MRFIQGLALFITTGLMACQAKQDTITASRKDAIIDSLVGSRMDEINRQAMEDLDRRKSIEVKAKADSIVNATLNPSSVVKPEARVPRDRPLPPNPPTFR